MSKISYDRGHKKVRQVLSYISLDEFEGDFDSVIKKLKEEQACYAVYTKEAQEITEPLTYGSSKGAYLDGTSKKSVKFDRIYLDLVSEGDDEKKFNIVGERMMDAGELAAMDKENEQNQEREIEQLRKLKEKYPGI